MAKKRMLKPKKGDIPDEILEQELEIADFLEEMETAEEKKSTGPYIAS